MDKVVVVPSHDMIYVGVSMVSTIVLFIVMCVFKMSVQRFAFEVTYSVEFLYQQPHCMHP